MVTFGKKKNFDDTEAKESLRPPPREDDEARDNYVKSHGRYLPGRQKRRDCSWFLDPATTTFGVFGKSKMKRKSGLHFDDANEVEKTTGILFHGIPFLEKFRMQVETQQMIVL